MTETILTMEKIVKIYPNGVVANNDVNFSVRRGEIHALVGENGAGKSTLMKILFGIEKQDSGCITINNSEVTIRSPKDAMQLGVGMVHQHFMLVPSLTVAENVLLGMEPSRWGTFISRREVLRRTEEASKYYSMEINPSHKVENLSVGQKQKIEILKALVRGAQILILDEPTSVLTPQESKELFEELRSLRNAGHTIIFISHKLDEIKDLCDRVTVLRDGKTIGVAEVSDVSVEDISFLMVNRNISHPLAHKANLGEPVLRVENLIVKSESGTNIVDDVSFCVREGGILGIAGIEGNGQRQISDAIAGLLEYEHGDIFLGNSNLKRKSISEIRDNGVAHISDDRMTYGAALDATIWENLISTSFRTLRKKKRLLLNMNAIHAKSRELIRDYEVKCYDHSQKVNMLSGGNIQKVVAARELSSNAKLILANQPTRGIDIGATEFIRNKLIELKREGSAILLISADLNEILQVSDSILVLRKGKIVAYFDNKFGLTGEHIGEYMLGIKTMSDSIIARVCDES